ncbi:MAG: chemotaxis protein CheW [Verrucomicrobium sp.]|nr:chemotaxis protein CheW [Verrucomicrobium sp.]
MSASERAPRLAATEILVERARKLAQPLVQPGDAVRRLDLIVFGLASERYALETRFVTEVCLLKDLVPLPCTPDFVAGIVNVRGRVLPVLDLRKFFDLPPLGILDLHQIILVQEQDMELGLLADTVAGLISLPVDEINPPMATLLGIQGRYLKGVTSDCLVVIDLEEILNDPAIIVHEEAQTQ